MSVEVQLAREDFLRGDETADLSAVRPEVAAAWRRAVAAGFTSGQSPRFVGHETADAATMDSADDVLSRFLSPTGDGDADSAISGLLVDDGGVIRARQDSSPTLGALLDRSDLMPGFTIAEGVIGPTAASLAIGSGVPASVTGAEHLHGALTRFACTAVPVHGGAVMLMTLAPGVSTALRVLAATLAHQIDRAADEAPFLGRIAVTEAFTAIAASQRWTLATDGDMVATTRGMRELDPADVRALTDAAQAALVLREEDAHHRMDLPSGRSVEVTLSPVFSRDVIVGTTMTARAASASSADPADPRRRRQGAHVAPLARRDFARDLRAQLAARKDAGSALPAHLATPAARARAETTTFTQESHSYVLLGEAGTGKRTLAIEQFRAVHPEGHVTVLECGDIGEYTTLPTGEEGRPSLIVIRGIHQLTPITARRLDDHLSQNVADALLAATLDANAVDPSRPYGLLLRHFHGTTRVPPLRARVDELGAIAAALLRRRAGGRSLRLSPQAVRVMEGYGWPGNISELDDVLRYASKRKQLGEIQPPDLPPVCFQGRARKLSMLEAAHCDAIIQALYESGGNRHRAAQMLGISRSSLYRKIEAFGISYVT